MLNDGIHPNDKGAQKMAQIIADAIKLWTLISTVKAVDNCVENSCITC
jgi:hypothetical protein